MKIKILAMSQDPIYIGTGGFTIGRVDNTIVRDPITRIPKIPGTSVAGTWRYYMALTLHSFFKDKYKISRSERGDKDIKELFIPIKEEKTEKWVKDFKGNRYAAIKCAGQDEEPNITLEDSQNMDTGHCGHCIVCKTFGFSKKDKSQRGLAYFSDLNILLFPVYTRYGVRWITSMGILNSADIKLAFDSEINDDEVLILKKDENDKIQSINLGWLNFNVKNNEDAFDKNDDVLKKISSDFNIECSKIIFVSDNIISQIINSNLETRTSVSIDPITGAAKEGALFTSEAIPRATIFYGNVEIEKRPLSVEDPEEEQIERALFDSRKYFETLGIGGMTTRGFGRLKIFDMCKEESQYDA